MVYKDSIFTSVKQPSINPGYLRLREKLITDKVLVAYNGNYKLEKDYPFNSPSAAAQIVLGRAASGPQTWKTSDGIDLKFFE